MYQKGDGVPLRVMGQGTNGRRFVALLVVTAAVAFLNVRAADQPLPKRFVVLAER